MHSLEYHSQTISISEKKKKTKVQVNMYGMPACVCEE